MMPEMDGIALCKKIKTNESTCHIPVILLTAKTNIEQRVEGLQIGADSYIPKPFNVDHLRIRVQKLIELRETLKQKFEGKLEVQEDTVKLKSADEIFLQKVDQVIKEQLSNSELSVETLGQHIGMSRSQLQRKLKQLMNQNPSDYIKTMRLRHAAHLLSTKKFAIAEIAYATGFSSQAHFSNSFKEVYGMSPTRYMEVVEQK
jgi:YesN/AraC family two-component response regulator